MATRRSKKNTNALIKNADKLKTSVKNIHDTALDITDSVVEGSIEATEQWQDVLAKALKDGVKLMGKQQNLVLSTLESIKGQYQSDSIRFKKLLGFGANESIPQAAKAKATDLVVKTKKVATKKAKAVVKEVKEAKATVKSDLGLKDNLKVVEGVGPKIESLLNAGGIMTYDHLAKAKAKTLRDILESAGPRYNMHDPSTWSKQAKLAASGKMKELKALKAELKNGKKVTK